MANRTQTNSVIHGTNPQYLIDQIIRNKIYQNIYWKEDLFALTAETLVDKAMELTYVGGCYGAYQKPTPFLQLLLKMLQIQPDMSIVNYFVQNQDYKYVSALGMVYLRLVCTTQPDVYHALEPFYSDYRKLRRRTCEGGYDILYMDQLAHSLLTESIYLDINMSRLTKRVLLEDDNRIEPRVSALQEELEQQADSRSRSRSRSEEKAGRKEWRQVVSNNRWTEEQPPQKDSVEYWNKIRGELGLSLL